MFRALSLTCLALLMVASGARAAHAKDTIAVLKELFPKLDEIDRASKASGNG